MHLFSLMSINPLYLQSQPQAVSIHPAPHPEEGGGGRGGRGASDRALPALTGGEEEGGQQRRQVTGLELSNGWCVHLCLVFLILGASQPPPHTHPTHSTPHTPHIHTYTQTHTHAHMHTHTHTPPCQHDKQTRQKRHEKSQSSLASFTSC